MRKGTKGYWNPKLNPDYAQLQLYVSIPHVKYIYDLLIDAPKTKERKQLLAKLQKINEKYQRYLAQFESTPAPTSTAVTECLAKSKFAKYAA